jgi:hypothetical protein
VKNYRTPRTLADATFEVGYPYEREGRLADLLIAVVCVVAAALIVIGII